MRAFQLLGLLTTSKLSRSTVAKCTSEAQTNFSKSNVAKTQIVASISLSSKRHVRESAQESDMCRMTTGEGGRGTACTAWLMRFQLSQSHGATS